MERYRATLRDPAKLSRLIGWAVLIASVSVGAGVVHTPTWGVALIGLALAVVVWVVEFRIALREARNPTKRPADDPRLRDLESLSGRTADRRP